MTAPVISSCSTPYAEQKIDLETASLQSFIDYALPVAYEWKEDAYLAGAELPIWENGSEPDVNANLSFLSSNDRTIWLVLIISQDDRGSFTHEELTGTFNSPNPPANPINLDEILDSKQALEEMKEYGILDHYRRFRRSIEPYLALEYSDASNEQGPMIWAGHFPSFDPPSSLIVEIDAVTGEHIRSFDPLAD